jgi:hypothetical protein
MARKQLERNDRNFGPVMRRDGSVCQYCGGLADSVDHVLPVSSFSDNSLVNLVAACMPCNLAASAFVFDSFEAKRAFIRKRRGIPGAAPAPVAEEDPGDDEPSVTVVDAVWGEPEDEDWPRPEDPPEILCEGTNKRGKRCGLLAAECLWGPKTVHKWLTCEFPCGTVARRGLVRVRHR